MKNETDKIRELWSNDGCGDFKCDSCRYRFIKPDIISEEAVCPRCHTTNIHNTLILKYKYRRWEKVGHSKYDMTGTICEILTLPGHSPNYYVRWDDFNDNGVVMMPEAYLKKLQKEK